MLITHVRPSELWGKKAYDTEGRYLGEVVAIASRRGVVRKVVVQRARLGELVRLLPDAEVNVEAERLVVPAPDAATPPRLRLVR
jgi:sporulation protein YlmC with PRC-barrel domain